METYYSLFDRFAFREEMIGGNSVYYLFNPVDSKFSLPTDVVEKYYAHRCEISQDDATYLMYKEIYRWHKANYSSHKVSGLMVDCNFTSPWTWNEWVAWNLKNVCNHRQPSERVRQYFALLRDPTDKHRMFIVKKVCLTGNRALFFFWDDKKYDFEMSFAAKYNDHFLSFEEVRLSHKRAEVCARLSMARYKKFINSNFQMTWLEWILTGQYLIDRGEAICRFEDRIIPVRERPVDLSILIEKARSDLVADLDALCERYLMKTRDQSFREAAKIMAKVINKFGGIYKVAEGQPNLNEADRAIVEKYIGYIKKWYKEKYPFWNWHDIWRDIDNEIDLWLSMQCPVNMEVVMDLDEEDYDYEPASAEELGQAYPTEGY